MNEFDSTQIYLDVSIILNVKTLIHNLGLIEGGETANQERVRRWGESIRVHS